MMPEVDITKEVEDALAIDCLAQIETRGYARPKNLSDVFVASLGKSERNALRLLLANERGAATLRAALGGQDRVPRPGSKQAASESPEDYRTRLGAEGRTAELFKAVKQ